MKAVGLAAFVLAALLLARDAAGVVVAVAASALIAGYLLRDLLAPVRLAADGAGVTVVSGFAGARLIPWRDVERIRIDERRRFGTRSVLLEIDAGTSLHLFSAAELGAPCEEAADALRRFRTGR